MSYSEVNSGILYKTAAERERLVAAEREYTTMRVKKIIELKQQVCDGNDKGFVVINQKVGTHFLLFMQSNDSLAVTVSAI